MAVRPEHAVEEFIAGCRRQAVQDRLDARAAAERRRSEVTGAAPIRLPATTLGRVEVSRIAYRAPAVSNLHPADARPALPDGGYSFPLQEAVVHETVTGALREARDGLAGILGQRVGTRQLMQISVYAVRDFNPQHRVPAPATRAGCQPGRRDLLVLSIDATGINMIDSGLREAAPTRNTGPQPPSAQLATRERAGRTRMAVVTACYDAALAVRDPADILPTAGGERASRRPGPTAGIREVAASIADSTVVMTRRLFDRAQQRDPQHQRRWIVLVDGNNHQIDRIWSEAHAHVVHIDLIVDFVHILEYLWKAVEDLHPTQPGRAGFVARTARELLEGHAPRVVADLNIHHDTLTQAGTTAPGLKRCIDYLNAKQPLPHRADHGLANRDRRDRGGRPLPRQRQNGDHRRPPEPARRRSRTPPARRDHERRFRSLLAIPSSTGTPTHPHQPLPAAIRPGRLTKIEKNHPD